jgi:hypothetical protein
VGSQSEKLDGCKKLNQWHLRDLKFFRDKSRILENFSGTEGILSWIICLLCIFAVLTVSVLS